MTNLLETEQNLPPEQLWRANVYGLLALLLGNPPSRQTLGELANLDIGDSPAQHTPLEAVWAALADRARNMPTAAVADEYNALFIGVTRGELLPYGSWYLSGFIMDAPLAELRSSLSKLGFERQPDVCEPEDHAAALCEVMRLLITGSRSGDRDSLLQQRDFFNQHILPWMPRFFEDLQQASHAEFYREAGKLGSEVMNLEDDYFRMYS